MGLVIIRHVNNLPLYQKFNLFCCCFKIKLPWRQTFYILIYEIINPYPLGVRQNENAFFEIIPQQISVTELEMD